MRVWRNGARLRTKSGFSLPSSRKRKSRKRKSSYPSLRGRRVKRAGMIWSVSTFDWSNGAATSSRMTNGSISSSEFANVSEPPGESGRCGHGRTDKVRAASRALPADEVAIGCRSAALARADQIAVHADAHGAARFTPGEACIAEDAVQPFGLGGEFHLRRSGHHE